MANLIIASVLASLCVATTAATSKYVSYNSSDLSYLSNGIQFPVAVNDSFMNGIVQDDLPEMKWVSQLFNHHNWMRRLKVVTGTTCRDDMEAYLKELNNGTSWAVKMFDASGRYSSQFFFGNDYWLGSYTLCQEVMNDENNDVPPFVAHFFVGKVRININPQLTPVTRQLKVGQCLPSSCEIYNVRRLLAEERLHDAMLSVVGIRPVPGTYSLFQDCKFYIIGGATILMLLLVTCGTLLEMYFEVPKVNQDIETVDNNNSSAKNNNQNITNEESEKSLEIKSDKRSSCQGLAIQTLLSFSLLTNGKKILNMNTSNESMRCLHGIRFFSILWIIMVHTYLEVFAIADNKNLRNLAERNFIYQTISNATFSVDTFFFISGLLVTVTYFKQAQSSNKQQDENILRSFQSGTGKFFVLIFYRFIRLTPVYLFVLGVNELSIRYLHNNSVFEPAIIDHITCAAYWWRNALYINNLFPQQEFCMLWSWYLSNDTQFFVIATAILIVAIRGEQHFRWAVGAILVFLISSWITTFTIAMKYNYIARVEEPFALFDQLYDKPWLRIGPYLVGMGAGYLLFRINFKAKLPVYAVFLGWFTSIACLCSLVYGLGKTGLVLPISAIYVAFGHTAWALALAWITIACCTNYGGPVNAILGFKGLLPLSRLTYCTYLVHPMIMCITSFQLDGPIHLHQGIVLVVFFGNIVVSFLLSFAISVVFEAPIVQLLKVHLTSSNKKEY